MITDANRKEVAKRDFIRAEAKLPQLDRDRELEKLRAALRKRIFEAVFQVERIRFDRWISEGEGFLSKMGRWSTARQTVMSELRTGEHSAGVLERLGYKLVEDCWSTEGRKTYLSDDAADRQALKDLQATLGEYGWVKDEHRLRCFRRAASGEVFEIEPGGSEVSGHLLHHLKSE